MFTQHTLEQCNTVWRPNDDAEGPWLVAASHNDMWASTEQREEAALRGQSTGDNIQIIVWA